MKFIIKSLSILCVVTGVAYIYGMCTGRIANTKQLTKTHPDEILGNMIIIGLVGSIIIPIITISESGIAAGIVTSIITYIVIWGYIFRMALRHSRGTLNPYWKSDDNSHS
jgi:hypothetical protein